MMARCSSTIALILAVLACGTAHATTLMSRSSTTESLKTKLLEGERLHDKSLEKTMREMNLPKAFKVLQKNSLTEPDVLNFLRATLATQAQGQQHVGAKRSSAHLRNGQAPATGYSGVDKAKDMLNEMIEEVQMKYDLELQKCCSFEETQSQLIEEARQDISLFNAEAADARREVLEAQTQIQICEQKLPQLAWALQSHNEQCEADLTDLRAQLAIVNADITVMSTILEMTDCSKQNTLLIQNCHDECTGASFLSFHHEPLQKAVHLLKSSDVRRLLGDSLSEAYSIPNPDINFTTTTSTQGPRTLKRSSPCKAAVPADKRTGKCSISESPNCPKLHEKFMYIQSGITDKRDELMDQINKLEIDCKKIKDNLEAQISFFDTELKAQQTALAAATRKQNNAEEQSRLKTTELLVLQKDYDEMSTTCHTNYATLEGEECGLKKIRGELYKMQGQDNPAFFQDCVVSEWLPGECSASCAGGLVQMTRQIVTHPVGGSKCPALVAQKPCNVQKCPVDCKLGDWEGWSSCTAKCGGGLRERERYTSVEPEHGGEPCGETSQAQSCHMGSCDKDCELGDWTEWSQCSKMCNRGTTDRMKMIIAPAVGDGSCARITSDVRMQEKECNAQSCVKPEGQTTLKCESKLDVILLIDGSAGGGQDGWDASVEASVNIAYALEGDHADVKLAVLLFGENVEMVQHFTSDIEATVEKIDAMAWPKSDPYTAQALDTAASELSLGRPEARSVVIVITNGKPMSMRKTRFAAKRLRQQARVMWIPVTEYAPLQQLRSWASRPVAENFIPVNNYGELKKPEVIDAIISDVCPEVS